MMASSLVGKVLQCLAWLLDWVVLEAQAAWVLWAPVDQEAFLVAMVQAREE